MEFEISKELFEHIVPALKEASGTVFTKMQSHLDAAKEEVQAMIEGANVNIDDDPKLLQQFQEVICDAAALAAVPQLDLVMTSTGFGIVSDGNRAPASRERVFGLTEQLAHNLSRATDRLHQSLLATPWRETPQAKALVSLLIWAPFYCNRYGITFDGHIVFQKDFLIIRTKLMAMEQRAAEVISPELYDKLLELTRTVEFSTSDEIPPAYALIVETTRRYITALMHENSAEAKYVYRQLQRHLERFAEELPEYNTSHQNAAKHVEDFQNTKGSGFFSF